MAAGALFLLVLIAIAIGVAGGGVYVIAARLRASKLHPEGDKIEGADGGDVGSRPEHLAVESDQHARSVGTR